MSYLALARKYRPSNFETLVGQTHVVRALSHALDRHMLHHAYLFTGTRGVGKTTIARIMATCLNCEQGPISRPCGRCSPCIDIREGRFADLIELDAATNTSVNDMRVLLDSAIYAPTSGRYKVYVIDEVHMLSTSAFNAMLKTLEEPPEHLKFILATTDPQKIPVTVMSRCLQLNLKPLPASLIAEHLTTILKTESIEGEEAALVMIAKAAKGSLRDALSLLDQAIAHGGGRIQTSAVREMLGVVESDYLYRLLGYIADHQYDALMEEAAFIEKRGLSPETVLDDLAQLIVDLSVRQWDKSDIQDGMSFLLGALCSKFSPDQLQLMYQICIYGKRDLTWAPDEHTGFVMTLLRLLAFSPDTLSDEPASYLQPKKKEVKPTDLEKISSHSNAGKSKNNPLILRESEKIFGEPKSISTVQQESVRKKTFQASSSPSSSPEKTPSEPIFSEPRRDPEMQHSLEETAYLSLSEAKGSSESHDTDENSRWHRLIDQMKLSGPTKLLAENCEWVRSEENQVVLRLPKGQHRGKTDLTVAKLEKSLAQVLNQDKIKVVFDIGETTVPTYAKLRSEERAAVHQVRLESLQTDPYVQKVVDLFEGQIDEHSIESHELSGEEK